MTATRGVRSLPLFNDHDLDASTRPIRTLSLFTGAGGLDIGFHDAGFKIIAAVEIEPAYAATLAANVGVGRHFGPGLRVHCQDIRTFDASIYADEGIECIIGGPPCQTFSAAGRRSGGVLGTDDQRGQLFRAYVDILGILKPTAFVFENVYGLPGANGGEPWREINDAFRGAGYTLFAEVLDTADYGVPQHRERLVMVGVRQGSFTFPEPTHGPDSRSGRPLVSARAAIAGIDPPGTVPPIGGLYGHLLPQIPPGLNYSYFTRELGHPAPQFAWRSKFHDFLYKSDPDYPVRTIKSKPGKFTGPFHWDNRHFTQAELKRLQSFPDDYDLVGSYNKVVEQIGNSVPPRLSRVIATSVREQLFQPREPLTYPVRSASFRSTFRQRQRERHRHFEQVAQRSFAETRGATSSSATAMDYDAYYAAFDGRFRRRFSHTEPRVDEHDRVFRVELRRSDRENVGLVIAPVGPGTDPSLGVTIEMSGLKKYLDHTDVFRLSAEVFAAEDVIRVWRVVERELVRQSRFFSLIDIYGHYANRGDTVAVTTVVEGLDPLLSRALNFFGNSKNCGVPMATSRFADIAGVDADDVPKLIDALRELRWDVRVRDTHPTLAPNSVLCTYPFPALSEKAHFDKGRVAPGLELAV